MDSGVFGGRGVRIRSAAGLELLNQWAFVFWPNFVHWASDWLCPKVQNGNRQFAAALRTVKTQVRVAAQTPATVFTTPGSRVLAFSDEGPYAETRLQLAGIYALQIPLFLFQGETAPGAISSAPRRLLSYPDG
jgi:Tfp pilus assembly protein FimT